MRKLSHLGRKNSTVYNSREKNPNARESFLAWPLDRGADGLTSSDPLKARTRINL
jgi:hypothetical protein